MASPTPPPGAINYEQNRNRLAVPSLILTGGAGIATGIELQNNGGVLDIPGGLSIAGATVLTAAGIDPAGTLALPGVAVGNAATGLTQGLSTNSLSLVANAIEAVRALTTTLGVDYLTVTPGVAGNPGVVALGAAGSDTNVSINLVLKGTGALQVGGVNVFPATPTPGTSVASSAAVLGANKNLDVLALPVGGLAIGAGAGTALTPTAAEFNALAGATAGAVLASKAVVAGAAGQIGGYGMPVPTALTTTASLTAAQSGSMVVLNSTTSFVVSLPAANALGAGVAIFYVFSLQVATASGAGHIIRPVGADTMLATFINTPAAAKGANNTQVTSHLGDMLSVWSDGVSKWYASADGGTWTREA